MNWTNEAFMSLVSTKHYPVRLPIIKDLLEEGHTTNWAMIDRMPVEVHMVGGQPEIVPFA